MKPFHQLLILSSLAAAVSQMPLAGYAQSSVSFTGSTYSQNFDSLPYTPGVEVNTSNPVTLNGTTYTLNSSAYSSNTSAAGTFDFASANDTSGTPTAATTGGFNLATTMPGWYGGATVSLKAGAQSGTQTTGGIIGFGTTGATGTTDSNRALGLLATSTTGVTFFGVKLINNSGQAISQINLGFTGELWRQTATAKSVNYGYFVDPTVSDGLPSASMAGFNTVGSISFAAGTAGTTVINTTGPLSTTSFNNNVTLNTPWTSGSALWLVWQEASAGSGSQGLAIDNLSVSVPEPGTFASMGLGLLVIGAFYRRRFSKAA